MSKIVLSIIVSFLGFSIMNIAQASQKVGLEMLPKKKGLGGFIWTLGIVGTFVATFVLFYAAAIGNVSLVGAMAGSGLASLTIFSIFVMKEKVGGKEIAGVAVILVAAVFIGLFSKGNPSTDFNMARLYIFSGILVVVYTVLWVVLSGKPQALGIVIGSFSGAMGGLIPMYQKVSASSIGTAAAFFHPAASTNPLVLNVLSSVANPYALLWVAISIGALVVLQFAYKKDQAIRIIPAYAATNIVVPIIGGLLSFHETLNPLQWVGIAAILAGVFLVTAKTKTEAAAK